MKMRVLTNSELKTFRACQRLHHYEYAQLVRPVDDEAPLRFGDVTHQGLATWWSSEGPQRWLATRDTLNAAAEDFDAFELAKARAMLCGYDARWLDESGSTSVAEVLAVEAEFRVPLINPATGAASRTFVIGGKLDAVARLADGRIVIVEHKTSSEDISPGSEYWRRLTLDTQISAYYLGARSLGFDVQGCLYDVLGKPAQKPLKATPVESRRYTKAGTLDARQRLDDETPDAYALRISAAIAEAPEKYYGRGLVVRLEEDEREAAYDTWQLARAIRDGELAGHHPRNPDSCSRYGRSCRFLDVCQKIASIDDPHRFRRAERAHEELSQPSSKEESTAA